MRSRRATPRPPLVRLAGLAAVAVLLVAGCSGDADRSGPPETTRQTGGGGGGGGGGGKMAAGAALLTFDECGPLLDHIHETATSRVGPGGFVDSWGGPRDVIALEGDVATAAPDAMAEDSSRSAGAEEGTDFSGTNVQEEGVDEPDVVKTDGDTLFVVRGTDLVAVDADGPGGVLGRVTVAPDPNTSANELLLAGDRALVLSTNWGPYTIQEDVEPLPAPAPEAGRISPVPATPTSTLTSVDVSDPANLRITDTVTVEGEYRTARMVDDVARIVLQSPGPQLDWRYPTEDGAAETREAVEANQALIEKTTLDDWLPHHIDLTTGERTELVDCGDVYTPASFAGSGLVTVLTVPLTGTAAVEPEAATVLAAADTVYASTDNLYVAAHAWPEFRIQEGDRIAPPEDLGTDLHRFDITGDVAVHTSSGRVEGAVLNQFSLSEHEGRLRVATTTTPPWGDSDQPESSSSVTVFEQQGEALVAIGSVGGLGKGETIQSVRFVGDTGYVVTFRQTDPFYVVDLSDPTAPRLAGELKLPGYSGYLHPIDDTHVLGVGQEGDADGRITGVKVSLFDVSDPSAPVESANWIQEGGQQSVEFDAKAFLYWPATRLAVVPVQVWSDDVVDRGGVEFNGAIGLTVGDSAIAEAGRITHTDQAGALDYNARIERSIVVGETLWTLSSTGLLASNLDSLTPGNFVALT